MFAVIKTGGKQYRVAEDQVLKVERIKGEPGTIVQIGDVLMLGGDTPQLGAPMVVGRERRGRDRRAGPRPEGHRLQEAPPQEFAAQARPPAGIRADPDLRNPDRRRQADQGPEAEARAKAKPAEGSEGDDATEAEQESREEGRGQGKARKVTVSLIGRRYIARGGLQFAASSIFV